MSDRHGPEVHEVHGDSDIMVAVSGNRTLILAAFIPTVDQIVDHFPFGADPYTVGFPLPKHIFDRLVYIGVDCEKYYKQPGHSLHCTCSFSHDVYMLNMRQLLHFQLNPTDDLRVASMIKGYGYMSASSDGHNKITKWMQGLTI